jgi:chemotaxis protein MotA
VDKLSIFGLLTGLIAIVGGQYLDGGELRSLIQPVALLIVGGGTLGAVMVQHPFATFKRSVRMLGWVIVPPKVNYLGMIDELKYWCSISRRSGLLALEDYLDKIEDPFIRKGLQMVVDGIDPHSVRSVLEIDLATYEDEMLRSAKLWEAAGGYSPTIGIIGAIMGLIHIMENLTNPSKLGAGIATAFVATIYGVGLANLVFIPVANKLKTQVESLVQMREMMLDGLCSIAAGENPTILENRLLGYVPIKN